MGDAYRVKKVVPANAVQNEDEVTKFLQGVGNAKKEAMKEEADVAAYLQMVNTPGGRRFSTAQVKLRNTMLVGSTPRLEARKHVLEKWTYTYLVAKLAIIGALSIFQIICARTAEAAAAGYHLSSPAGTILTVTGALMFVSVLPGAYGAHRVRSDIQVDDDGLKTPGQHLLQAYFHVAFGATLIALPVSLAVLSDPGSFLNEGNFGDAEFYCALSASISLFVTVLTMVAMKSTVQIVTLYEISQSFLESFSTLLVGVGVAGIVVCSQMLVYTESLQGESNSIATGVYVLLSFSAFLVVISVLGLGAAFIENIALLRIHMASMAFLFVGLLSGIIVLATTDLNAAVSIGDGCRSIMQSMAESWWNSSLECSKYGGAAVGAQIESFDPVKGKFITKATGVGTSAHCPESGQVAYAWEYLEAGSNASRLFGCLNLACCQLLANRLEQYLSILFYGIGAVMACVLIGIACDKWLVNKCREETDMVKAISRRHAHALLLLIFIMLVGAISAISLTVHLNGQTIAPEQLAAQLDTDQSIVSAETAATTSVSRPIAARASAPLQSCTNGKKEGNETDVDCGSGGRTGGCAAKCSVGRSCAVDADCASGFCNSTSFLCRAPSNAEQCTNGFKDGSETGPDCGGVACLELLAAAVTGQLTEEDAARIPENATLLCQLGVACGEDKDCASGLCSDGFCGSCYDGLRSEGEGDVDCGSANCVDYFAEYPSLAASGNADGRGRCLDGRRCTSPSQCASGVCSQVSGTCVSCGNGIMDGDETGVDCGGSVCTRRCDVGDGCQYRYDCKTERCSTDCADGVCGLGECLPLFNFDAQDLNQLFGLSASYIQIAISCSNSEKDSTEADVDCGGNLCRTVGLLCEDGRSCNVNADCDSHICFQQTCSSCFNNVTDGAETAPDCGGPHCKQRCGPDDGCASDSDCQPELFCFTDKGLENLLAEANETGVAIDDLYLPETNTCQQAVRIAVHGKECSMQSAEGGSTSECFSKQGEAPPQPPGAAGEEEVQAGENDPLLDEGGRLLETLSYSERIRERLWGMGRHSRQLSTSQKVGSTLVDSSFFFEGDTWPYLCQAVSTYTVEAGFRFEVIEEKGALTSLPTPNRLIVTRKYGAGVPVVFLRPTSCSKLTGETQVTVTQEDIFQEGCGLRADSTQVESKFVLPTPTVVQGRVYTAGNQNAESLNTEKESGVAGATVRLYTKHAGSCAALDPMPSGKGCEFFRCTSFGSSFGACSSDGAGCCVFRESESLSINACVSDDPRETTYVTTTDLDGNFEMVIPTLETPPAGKRYRFEYVVGHDRYVTSQGVLDVPPGSLVKLTGVFVGPATLEACQCRSFEETDLNSQDTLCHNPVTRHCARLPEGQASCTQSALLRPCANDISGPEDKQVVPAVIPQQTMNTLLFRGALAKDYGVRFSITAWKTQPQWSNILHVGASDSLRRPAIWLYPGSTRLHIRSGTTLNFNDGCDPALELEIAREYSVVVEAFADSLTVVIDGRTLCNYRQQGEVKSQGYQPFYTSDPWYTGSYVTVKSLEFYNITNRPTPAPTAPLPQLTKGRVNNVQGSVLGWVNLAQNWNMTMQLTVYDTINGIWTNVLHVGLADSERSPAIWVYPGSANLHIRVGGVDSWNHGCDVAFQMYETFDLAVECFAGTLSVWVNRVLRCRNRIPGDFRTLGPRPVYNSNPWYIPAYATTTGIAFRNIADRPTPAPTRAIPKLARGSLPYWLTLGPDWEVVFTIKIHQYTEGVWTNVFRVGSSDGIRSPAVWVYPNSIRLHIRAGTTDNWNEGCDTGVLSKGQEYRVRVEFFAQRLVTFVDDAAVCSSEFLAPFRLVGRQPLYVSDPWYTPAYVDLSGPFFRNITERVTAAPVPAVVRLTPGNIDRWVALTTNYEFVFVISPRIKTSSWSNILHVGNSDRERSPAVWFYPWSLRLHIRVGTLKNFNNGCDPQFEMSLYEEYQVRVRVFDRVVTVTYNDQQVAQCNLSDEPATYGSRPVYVSNPWYTGAGAVLSGLEFSNLVTQSPTLPTKAPSKFPTKSPTTAKPTKKPTLSPTLKPTVSPSESPTKRPSLSPTPKPTNSPSVRPTESPTKAPSGSPTLSPSSSPSRSPSESPTGSPTRSPSASPTGSPSRSPTASPTHSPSVSPSQSPSTSPTWRPTSSPTGFVEPFVSFTLVGANFDWLVRATDGIKAVISKAGTLGAGRQDFGKLADLEIRFTEIFDLRVDDMSLCTQSDESLKDAIRLARCGPRIPADRCVVSFNKPPDPVTQNPSTVFNVSISIRVESEGDAELIDARTSSPQLIQDIGGLTLPLASQFPACFEDARVGNASAQGTFEAAVAINTPYVVDLKNKTLAVQKALGEMRLEEDFNRLLPMAAMNKVDLCPAAKTCGGRGVCCNELDTYKFKCQVGECYCNQGYTGVNCEVERIQAQDLPAAKKCVPRDFIGGNQGGFFADLCGKPGACEANPLLCEYERDFAYSEVVDGCAGGTWMKVFHQKQCQVLLNLGEVVINALFMLKRQWRYDIGSKTYLFYKLFGTEGSEDLPDPSYNAYNLMISDWSSLNSKHLINAAFGLYSAAEDLVNDQKRWEWCNYDDRVGFPRDCRQKSAGAFNPYKWAMGFCNIWGRKQSPLEEFSFHVCVPDGAFQPPDLDDPSARRPPPTFSFSGSVSDIQTGSGVQARISLLKGSYPAYADIPVMQTHSVTVATSPASEPARTTSTVGLNSCTDRFVFNSTVTETAGLVRIDSSTFRISGLATGTYTAVFEYDAGLALKQTLVPGAAGISNDVSFEPEVVIFNVVDSDVSKAVAVTGKVGRGSLLLHFQTLSSEVDFVASFVATEDGNRCVVSRELLSDGVCSCGGVAIIRADSAPDPVSKLLTQTILLTNVRATSYSFYLARVRPIPNSSYKKHRDDGRCGGNFPIPSGEAAQCPPVSVVWGDGIRSLRPCCNLAEQRCGIGAGYCNDRFSVDFRRFAEAGSPWVNDTRKDGICNMPGQRSSRGTLATCPEQSPCCGPNARCGATAYHCNSERSVDYRPFYTLLREDAAKEAEAFRGGGQLPLEESASAVKVFSEQGFVASFSLPKSTNAAASTNIHYFDGHTYEEGVASESSTYARMFCIDGSQGAAPQLHKFQSPVYFQYLAQLAGTSQECPASAKCKFIQLNGLAQPYRRSGDNWLVPYLGGVFVRRFVAQEGSDPLMTSKPGFYVKTYGACQLPVSDFHDGNKRWAFELKEGAGEAGPRKCIELCQDTGACQAVAYLRQLSNQVFKEYCYFHKNIAKCGGATRDSSKVSWRQRALYIKQSPLLAAKVWYSQTETMLYPTKRQVHLYLNPAKARWYLDNDLAESNGVYAWANAIKGSELPPEAGWRYNRVNATWGASVYTKPLSVEQFSEDCLVGGNYPKLDSVTTKSSCQCTGASCIVQVDCPSFPLRISDTGMCLSADDDSEELVANVCDPQDAGQRFVYNSNLKQLEVGQSVENGSGETADVAWFVVGADPGKNKFILVPATSTSSVPVRAAVKLVVFESYLCIEQTSQIFSYSDLSAREESRMCASLSPVTGARLLMTPASDKLQWTKFDVL